MRRFAAALVALLIAAAVAGVRAEEPAAKAELPVTRIVLFSSGVGYFQRDGQVNGSARIDLQFHAGNINDLLKSLILQDRDGGNISTVNYDNRDPIEKTLKSFAIDLTANPGVGQLLGQVRGERIEVIASKEAGKSEPTETYTGTIVGVEKKKQPVGKDQVIEAEYLNLLTELGLQSVALDRVQRLRFLRPELDQEFRKALEVLATGHDKQKKTVSLNFLGNGKRRVRVGYVTESPIWKTSYRLSLEKEAKDGKAHLQGWAIVENTTDEDWSSVRMGLVSGRPISFEMDLYEPLYVKRPVVEPELFASLRPQTYEGDMEAKDKARAEKDSNRLRSLGYVGGAGRGAMMGMQGPASATRDNLARKADGAVAKRLAAEEAESEKLGALGQGVSSAALPTSLGEYFKYELEQPVSLARQKSALIPIVNEPVEAAKVSIYNQTVQPKYPLLGLRFKNSTALHLMQGPITVFDGGSYAGDARIADLQPNETRLLSYAIDLGTEVATEAKPLADAMVSVKVIKGVLHATHKLRQTHHYTIKNRSDHERLVLVEQPFQPEWHLVQPEKPAERTRNAYRFEVKAAPDKPQSLQVVEETQRVDQIVLTNSDDETIRLFIRASVTSPKLKDALAEILKLKLQLAETQHEQARVQQKLDEISKDQARMRANMERVPPTSEAYKRYLKKFDDQETEIEKRQTEVARLAEQVEKERKAYELYLVNLTVE